MASTSGWGSPLSLPLEFLALSFFKGSGKLRFRSTDALQQQQGQHLISQAQACCLPHILLHLCFDWEAFD